MKPSKTDIDNATDTLLRSMETPKVAHGPRQISTEQGDEDQLASLEKHIRNLEQVLTCLRTNLRDRISTAKQNRNTLVPIHRLPAELLLHTFTLALSGTPVGDYYKGLSRIARVSKVFHNLVDNSPPMWSHLSPKLPSKLIQKALHKSRQSRLTVEDSQYSSSAIRQLMDTLANQTFRLYSIDLAVDSNFPTMHKFLKSPAPALERLRLRTTAMPQPLMLFGGDIPHLRELALHGIMLNMEGKEFSKLVSFTLTNLYGRIVSVSRILEIVATNPLLETLHLERIELESPENLSTKGHWVLPRLKRLRLELSFAATTTFLNCLILPAVQQLLIRHTSPYKGLTSADQFEGSLNQLSSFLRSTNDTSNPDQQMELYLGKSDVSFRLGNIYIHFEVANPYETLEWIAATLTEDCITRKCTLQLRPDLILRDNNLYEWLNKWPCITTLKLYAQRPAKEIINRLSLPNTSGPGPRWLFPKLEELHVHDHTANTKGILNMVRARYGKTGPTGQPKKSKGKDHGPKQSNLPPPFTLLDLRGVRPYGEAAHRDLGKIVGRRNIIWSRRNEYPEEAYYNQAGYDRMGRPQADEGDLDWW